MLTIENSNFVVKFYRYFSVLKQSKTFMALSPGMCSFFPRLKSKSRHIEFGCRTKGSIHYLAIETLTIGVETERRRLAVLGVPRNTSLVGIPAVSRAVVGIFWSWHSFATFTKEWLPNVCLNLRLQKKENKAQKEIRHFFLRLCTWRSDYQLIDLK